MGTVPVPVQYLSIFGIVCEWKRHISTQHSDIAFPVERNEDDRGTHPIRRQTRYCYIEFQ